LAAFPAASILLELRRRLSRVLISFGIKGGVSNILSFVPELSRARSVWGKSRQFVGVRSASALPPKADIYRTGRHVSKVPIAANPASPRFGKPARQSFNTFRPAKWPLLSARPGLQIGLVRELRIPKRHLRAARRTSCTIPLTFRIEEGHPV
jgi:hypothetical protein